MRGARGWLYAALCSMLVAVLWGIGAGRLVAGSPRDLVGIGLYSAALVGFAAAATGFYIRWRKERLRDEREETDAE